MSEEQEIQESEVRALCKNFSMWSWRELKSLADKLGINEQRDKIELCKKLAEKFSWRNVSAPSLSELSPSDIDQKDPNLDMIEKSYGEIDYDFIRDFAQLVTKDDKTGETHPEKQKWYDIDTLTKLQQPVSPISRNYIESVYLDNKRQEAIKRLFADYGYIYPSPKVDSSLRNFDIGSRHFLQISQNPLTWETGPSFQDYSFSNESVPIRQPLEMPPHFAEYLRRSRLVQGWGLPRLNTSQNTQTSQLPRGTEIPPARRTRRRSTATTRRTARRTREEYEEKARPPPAQRPSQRLRSSAFSLSPTLAPLSQENIRQQIRSDEELARALFMSDIRETETERERKGMLQ